MNETEQTLEKWAGSKHLGLTLVFTDIVASTRIGKQLGDTKWIESVFKHFTKARELAAKFDCHVVKVIGDSLMMAFRTSSEAVIFAIEFASDTGVDYIGIRVGINSGEVQLRDNDIYGLNVNFTSRVQHALELEGILMSQSVKRDFEKTLGAASGVSLSDSVFDLKSFGRETLWKATTKPMTKAVTAQTQARRQLLGPNIPSWIL
jgi:class 3 adenylate cyclase